jgi:hypothetical protein
MRLIVMAGLGLAIHVFTSRASRKMWDGWHKAGHDGVETARVYCYERWYYRSPRQHPL